MNAQGHIEQNRETANPGVFVISLDLELAWGTHDRSGFSRFRKELTDTRQAIARILELFERYDVGATWAAVGHLFLDHCSREDGVAHPDVLTPSYPWFDGHWHKHDPCTDTDHDPFWYGADIIRRILSCPVPQEIGCHTFSHVVVGDPACSAEILQSQVAACIRLAGEWGVELRSFVFPRDSAGHLHVLRDNGFTVFRGQASTWHMRLPGKLRALGHFADRMLALPPPTYRVEDCASGDIVNAPGSMLLMRRTGLRKLIPGAQRVRQARLGLGRAAERGELFHLTMHPWEMASSPLMIKWLEEILKIADGYRAGGLIEVMTMGQFADYAQRRQGPL